MAWISRQRSTARPIGLAIRSSQALIVTAVAVSIFTDMFLYGVIVPVIPFALHAKANIPEDQVQRWISILLAVYGAAVLAASPVTGYLADRTASRRYPFLFGLITLAGSTAVLCAASSIGLFIAGRILQGISAAIVWSIGLALLVDTVPKGSIGLMLGYVSVGMGAGILLAPLLAGIVFNKGGYYAVFAMCFALLAVDVFLRLVIIEKKIAAQWLDNDHRSAEEEQQPSLEAAPPPSEDTKAGAVASQAPTPQAEPLSSPRRGPKQSIYRRWDFGVLLSSSQVLCGMWGVLATSILLTAFDSVLPLFVRDTFGWSSLQAGLIFLPLAAAPFFGPAFGYIADRWGARWIATAGFVLGVPLFVLLRFVTHASAGQIALLCILLFGISLAMSIVMTPLMAEMTYAMDAIERDKPGIFGTKGAYAQTYSLFNVAFSGGCLLGPILAGLIRDSSNWATMAWSLAVVSGFSAIPTALFVSNRSHA